MEIPSKNTARQRILSTLSFTLFAGWLLSFPYIGQVLYRLADEAEVSIAPLFQVAVLAHFAGLFLCGFLVKNILAGKMTMVAVTIVCFSGTLIFLLPYSALWHISLAAMGFFSGLFVASWGYFLKTNTPPEHRLRTVADVLIFSNVLMTAVNALMLKLSPLAGLAVLQLFLVGSLLGTSRLNAYTEEKSIPEKSKANDTANISGILKPIAYLSLFILILTINSGLMFQVVSPAFAHHETLTVYYWPVPYILAIAIIRNLPGKINIAYLLYTAIIMIGLAYLAFMWLDRSVASYLIINTLMMGAFGVCDLFWWSILGNIVDYTHNPAQVFGIGLSMNVLGVILGGFLGSHLVTLEDGYSQVTNAAVIVIFLVMLMLPAVSRQLTRLLKSHTFLIEFAIEAKKDLDNTLPQFKTTNQLTEKETEIVELLLRGYTYKAISEHLYISENTLKYHVKNVYQKLNIKNKMELVRLFARKETKA